MSVAFCYAHFRVDGTEGFPGIYLGQSLSPILPALVGLIYFKSRVWEREKLMCEHSKEGI